MRNLLSSRLWRVNCRIGSLEIFADDWEMVP